jgi:5-methylcytosine-specific restriction endonuclease McrA
MKSKGLAYRRFYSLKSRANKLGAELPFSRESFIEWFEAHKHDLCPCGAKADTLDHRIPLARNGGHELANYQMLCGPCNHKKWRWLDGEERVWPWQIPGCKHTTTRKRSKRVSSRKEMQMQPGQRFWLDGQIYVYPEAPL